MGALGRTITRVVLVGSCVAGTVAFSIGFLLTYVARPQIEAAAQGFLRAEVEREARAKLGNLADALLTDADRARAVGAGLRDRAAALQRLGASRWPDVIGRILAELCNIDCEEEKQRKASENASAIRGAIAEVVAKAKDKLAGLRGFVVGQYKEKLYALIGELRIFAGLNAAIFGATLFALWRRRRDMRPVLLPVAVLATSTVCAVYLYAATQDWFWVILLGDYMGFWYLAVFGASLAFVTDIVFFEARTSLAIVGSLPNALVPPC